MVPIYMEFHYLLKRDTFSILTIIFITVKRRLIQRNVQDRRALAADYSHCWVWTRGSSRLVLLCYRNLPVINRPLRIRSADLILVGPYGFIDGPALK